jgi:predicted nucleotide-binding protein
MAAPSRQEIETVFDVFEKHAQASKLPPIERPIIAVAKAPPAVFIGHGRNRLWRDLKDHLQDKHEIKVIAYETGARAGHSIRDILEEMVSKSSFAVLVLTGEDEQPDGLFRARQNVIHEIGLFQGRLGFSRAIMLVEEETEDFSNIHGIQYIRFSKGNIRETFGEILATLKREFGA